MNWICHVWKNHKTKALGFFQMLCGALQVQSVSIANQFSPQHFGWFLFVMGMLTASLGYLNSHQDDNRDEHEAGGP